MRLYVNFFQPCLRLISKVRFGAKVIKKYDKAAKTPYQRLMNCETLSDDQKNALVSQYNKLDPLKLLKELQKKQEEFWRHAWTSPSNDDCKNIHKHVIPIIVNTLNEEIPVKLISLEHFKNTNKPRKFLKPRTWRTRKDSFVNVIDSLVKQLNFRPKLTSKDLLKQLVNEYPNEFKMKQLRSLQRRLSEKMKEQLILEKKTSSRINDECRMFELMYPQTPGG